MSTTNRYICEKKFGKKLKFVRKKISHGFEMSNDIYGKSKDKNYKARK